MKAYKKGARFEREVIDLFRHAGYEAQRTAGSHSPFDIVLVKYTPENKRICFVAFVQCKIKQVQKESREPEEQE